MKNLKFIPMTILIATLALILTACGSKTEESADVANAKPYPLDGCLVCGMKLSMMSKPETFVYQGQVIKVCDATEKAEFEKDPAKYLKKITDAEAEMKNYRKLLKILEARVCGAPPISDTTVPPVRQF